LATFIGDLVVWDKRVVNGLSVRRMVDGVGMHPETHAPAYDSGEYRKFRRVHTAQGHDRPPDAGILTAGGETVHLGVGFKRWLKCPETTIDKLFVIPNARQSGGGACCCEITGEKQIPPQASPSFGMTALYP
jgi:hypothetical protein